MTRLRVAAVLWGILLSGLVPQQAPARELWRSGDASLEFSGSLRNLFQATKVTDAGEFASAGLASGDPLACVQAARFADCEGFRRVGDRDASLNLTRLRMRFDLGLTRQLSAVLVYDQEFLAGILDTLGDTLAGDPTDTFLGLEREIHMFGLQDHADRRRWRHLAYRAFLRWEGDSFDAAVGRQRIPWGVGRLWRPLDRFNFVPPLAIEGDQSPGVDAVQGRWLLNDFDFLQAVYAPATRHQDAAYALRFHGLLRDVDYSLVAGVFEEARTFGLDLSTNLGGAAVRLEAVYTNPERKVWPVGRAEPRELDRYWQMVVSADRNFEIGSGLYVLAEHLYNGNDLGFGRGLAGPLLPFFESTSSSPPGLPGLPASLGPFVTGASSDILGGSRVVSRGRHLSGLQLSYELSVAWRGDLLALYDWDGQSAAFFPTLVFTGSNVLEVSTGVQLFTGGRHSEYGTLEPRVFVLTELFF